MFHCSLWPICGRMLILQIIVSKMTCGLQSDSHEHSPYQRVHIEVLLCVFWLATYLAVADSSRLSRDVERKHEICGSCSATPSRPRHWLRNFPRQIFLAHSWTLRSWFVPEAASFLALSFIFASLFATLKNSTRRQSDLNLQRQVSLHFVLWLGALSISGRFDALKTRRCKRACRSLRNKVQSWLRLCHNSLFSCSLLHPFRHRFGAAGRAENADIVEREKVIPFISWETLFG